MKSKNIYSSENDDCSIYINILVFGSSVTTEKANVVGCYGDSVNLTWDVTLTGNDTKITIAALHTIDNTTGNANVIAQIDTTNTLGVSSASYRTRLSFTGSLNLIERKTTLTITIDKLQFIDATTYRLRIIAFPYDELDGFIKLSVQGMLF